MQTIKARSRNSEAEGGCGRELRLNALRPNAVLRLVSCGRDGQQKSKQLTCVRDKKPSPVLDLSVLDLDDRHPAAVRGKR
jgi:hypothetical protein